MKLLWVKVLVKLTMVKVQVTVSVVSIIVNIKQLLSIAHFVCHAVLSFGFIKIVSFLFLTSKKVARFWSHWLHLL